MTFELSWSLPNDYLGSQGFLEIKTPRSALKKAFEVGLIRNGHNWMELLENRDLTTHSYDEAIAIEVEKLIHQNYYPLLKELYDTFRSIANGS